MLGYNFELAWRSLLRFPRISILSVIALALGIGTTVTARTVTSLLSADPLPSRSASLYAVQMGASRKVDTTESSTEAASDLITWQDVQQLQYLSPAIRQTAVVNTAGLTVGSASGSTGKEAKNISGLQVQSSFFKMFDVPLLEGSAWSSNDDALAQSVAVISQELSQRMFGSANALGQPIEINGKMFRVVAVSREWKPYPHFYGLGLCTYECDAEQVFIPVASARAQGVPLASFSTCGDDNSITRPDASTCPYLGFWVQLDDAQQYAEYTDTLKNYVAEQRRTGRFSKGSSSSVAVESIRSYLDDHNLVPISARFGVWLALSFLLVCLANVSGLLLTRFLRSSTEFGIRRALGASRRVIFVQCLVEAVLIGVAGGLLALPLVWVGLWLIHQQPVAYSSVISMNWSVLFSLLGFSVVASAAIGAVPAWRASMIEPGLQMKGC